MSGNPLTMMLISTAARVVMSGIASNRASQSNQMIAEANAAAIRQQAEIARQNAEFNAKQQREKGKRDISRARTGFAKGGVEIAGTPVEVLGEMAAEVEFDALTTLYGGELEAQSMLNRANLSQYEGRVERARGEAAQKQSVASAGVSLLGAGFTSGLIPPIKNPFTTTNAPFSSGSYSADPNIFR